MVSRDVSFSRTCDRRRPAPLSEAQGRVNARGDHPGSVAHGDMRSQIKTKEKKENVFCAHRIRQWRGTSEHRAPAKLGRC